MLVIVTEAVPQRLRGYLSRWLLEVRAGVYVGNYSVRVRQRLWEVVCAQVGDGNAVLAWTSSHESGFEFLTVGTNSRTQIDWDGLPLVTYTPKNSEGNTSVDSQDTGNTLLS
jgi:CRISPR-associated endoribonuclease Cas2, subtype I-E/ECOLI